MHRPLHADALVAFLNGRKPQLRRARRAIGSYVAWVNADCKGELPQAAQALFVRPIGIRLRRIGRRLDPAPLANRDWGATTLIAADAAGLLQRVRECEGCGVWFFASTLKKRVCSDDCRKRRWRISEAGRAYQRGYMRAYRANEQTRAGVAMAAARVERKKCS